MRTRSPVLPLFLLALAAWIVSMGALVYVHAYRLAPDEDRLVTSDVSFSGEQRYYYAVYRDGAKIGYRSESWLPRPNMYLVVEETVLKMNLSGMSREVFLQSVAAVDSASHLTKNVSFTLASGAHSDVFDGVLSGDSLTIAVKKHILDPQRTGSFKVDESITTPTVLPFYLAQSPTKTMSFQIFDPLLFTGYVIHSERKETEVRTVDGKQSLLTVYDMLSDTSRGSMWLDTDGRMVRAEQYPLFGGIAGNFTLEKASGRDVFMLPVEVSFGDDILSECAIVPDTEINDPREVSELDLQLTGIRAANIDIGDAAKEFLGANPVTFRIHNRPVIDGDRRRFEREVALLDTAVVGSSDYIHPTDGRIVRTARDITAAETDTLVIARMLRQWVSDNMDPYEDIRLVRSIDILRELKGGPDAYTKLFCALSRSLGIRTQVHMGLVYREGAFRYHSWPAVFIGGVWHSLDPFFGQNSADATHITLLRGDFERQVELLRVIPMLSIDIQDIRWDR